MSLLRTILIIIVIYYVIQIVTRYVLPGLFYNYMDNKMDEFSKGGKTRKEESGRREGEVTVNYKSDKNRNNKHDKGEYVDYEEIKD